MPGASDAYVAGFRNWLQRFAGGGPFGPQNEHWLQVRAEQWAQKRSVVCTARFCLPLLHTPCRGSAYQPALDNARQRAAPAVHFLRAGGRPAAANEAAARPLRLPHLKVQHLPHRAAQRAPAAARGGGGGGCERAGVPGLPGPVVGGHAAAILPVLDSGSRWVLGRGEHASLVLLYGALENRVMRDQTGVGLQQAEWAVKAPRESALHMALV